MAFIRRITLVDTDGSVTLDKKKNRKRKVSRWLRPTEKRERRMLEVGGGARSELLRRHERSNRKHRNGWLRNERGEGP